MKKNSLFFVAAIAFLANTVCYATSPMKGGVGPFSNQTTKVFVIQDIVALELNGNVDTKNYKVCYQTYKKYIGKKYVIEYSKLGEQIIFAYSPNGTKMAMQNASVSNIYQYWSKPGFDKANRMFYRAQTGGQQSFAMYFNMTPPKQSTPIQCKVFGGGV